MIIDNETIRIRFVPQAFYFKYNKHIRDKKLVLGERKSRYDDNPINKSVELFRSFFNLDVH